MKYIFDGNKNELIRLAEEKCNEYNSDFKDNIQVFSKENSISIGLSRTNHGAGYWYTADIMESDNRCSISGSIELISNEKESLLLLIIIWFFFWPLIILIRLIFNETFYSRRKKLNRFLCDYLKCSKDSK